MDAVEVFGARLQRAAGFADAHVVVQHVDGAAKALARLGKQALHVGRICHVTHQRGGRAAFGLDERRGLFG